MKWPGKRDRNIPHLWDFEGRCETCAKNLILYMTALTQQKIVLKVEECSDHPGSALILYPQRDDVIKLPTPIKED